MTVNEFDTGDVVVVGANFTNDLGAPANPTTVVLTLQDPFGAETTPAAANVSTGRYEHSFIPLVHGTWRFRFASSGTIEQAEAGRLYVRPRMGPV